MRFVDLFNCIPFYPVVIIIGTVMDKMEIPPQLRIFILMAVLGLSYLQPFEDGNKRTARVFANSLLLRAGCAPLSYRSVDEREYKEATLIFYEQNSIRAFRELFVEQYVYSATHYNIAEGGEACSA